MRACARRRRRADGRAVGSTPASRWTAPTGVDVRSRRSSTVPARSCGRRRRTRRAAWSVQLVRRRRRGDHGDRRRHRRSSPRSRRALTLRGLDRRGLMRRGCGRRCERVVHLDLGDSGALRLSSVADARDRRRLCAGAGFGAGSACRLGLRDRLRPSGPPSSPSRSAGRPRRRGCRAAPRGRRSRARLPVERRLDERPHVAVAVVDDEPQRPWPCSLTISPPITPSTWSFLTMSRLASRVARERRRIGGRDRLRRPPGVLEDHLQLAARRGP